MTCTAHSLHIAVPWSHNLDGPRDLNWKGIHRFFRAFGTKRQGEKMSAARLQRLERGRIAYERDQQLQKDGIQGEERRLELAKALKMSPNTTDRTLRRYIEIECKLVGLE